MKIYTKRGDDGSTGLLYGGRVQKDDLRVEAYGATDEAVAALGLARAACSDDDLSATILHIQRELFVVGAELATDGSKRSKLKPGVTLVTTEMVDALETMIDTIEARIEMPTEFVVPGETATSAALEVARAIVRRAERRTVALDREGGLPDSQVIRYLNRLADALWMLARTDESGYTPARTSD